MASRDVASEICKALAYGVERQDGELVGHAHGAVRADLLRAPEQLQPRELQRARQGLMDSARHLFERILNPRFVDLNGIS
jgi:hypothetical protein